MNAGTVHWFNQCVERGKTEVFSEIITVTPALAELLLKRNPDNRNIRAAKVAQYASDMRTGNWTLNGESLIISRDGLLNDGQNRLTALAQAKVVLELLFTFGIERDARTTVDQGAARAAGDYLGMDGTENASIAASIGRSVICIERNHFKTLARLHEVTNAEIVARVKEDPKIGEAAHYAACVYAFTKRFAAPSIIGTAFYFFAGINEAEAREYCDQVAKGENLKIGDPAYAVRDVLGDLGRGQRGPKLETLFRGWSKYRTGMQLKLVRLTGTLPDLD